MHNPKITVLMTLFNGEKYLREAMESMLNQTYKDFEFLIIDDASTDSSSEIILSYKDPRIRLIENEQNIGFVLSLNKGLQLAKGEYIARMDADDISMPERLEKQIKLLEENPKVGMTACWISIIHENNNEISFWKIDRQNNSSEEIYYILNFENCLAHSSVIFRKELVIEIGGYDEDLKLTQDYDLWIRLSRITTISKLMEVLVIRREHESNMIFTANERLNQETFRIYQKNSNINFVKPEFIDRIVNNPTSINILKILNVKQISNNIIKNCPIFINKKELMRCAEEKTSTLLKNSFPFNKTIRLKGFVERSLGLDQTLKMFQKIKNIILYTYNDLKKIDYIINSIDKIDNKINVLFIVPSMTMGGAEKVNFDIIKNINKNKFQIHIITTDNNINIWKKAFLEYTNKIYELPNLFHNPLVYTTFILKYIKSANINIILISNSRRGYYSIKKIKQSYPKIKIFDLNHGESLVWRNGILYPYIFNQHNYIDKRITISNHLKNYLMSVYSFKPNEILVIKNGIDLNEYDKNKYKCGKFRNKYNILETDFVVSSIGRLFVDKHVEYFIDIANKIVNLDNKKYYKFLIAGDGPSYMDLQDKIIRYNLAKNVFMVGRINVVQEFYNDTDILLMTSETEGIPLVILEAMAMEVPVISTNVGAISEIIDDNINGFLIKYNEKNMINEFVIKIYLLETNSLIYQSLVENGKEKIISEHSLNKMIHSYEALFQYIHTYAP